MKAKVLKPFRDKVTGELHKVGDIISCTKKRYNEILLVDKLIEEIEEKNAENEDE